MGMLEIAQAAARIGFSVAGNVKKTVTIKTGPTPGALNTATDTTAPTVWAHTTTIPNGVIVYDDTEGQTSDATNSPTARKKIMLVQGVDVPAYPTETSLVVYEGNDWTVGMVETDPAGATHKLSVRR